MRHATAAASARAPEDRDPVGIVIADGGPGDRAPRFSAFVWGPVPEEEVAREPLASAVLPALEPALA